jgi:hypothetical protein
MKTVVHYSTRWPGIILFFLVTAFLFTWPLPIKSASHVIGPFLGDNLEYVWKIWWVEHAFFDLGQGPFFVPQLYYPYGYPLAFGEITPSHTFLYLPITAFAGPVLAYNLAIILSFVLSGFFMYLFVSEFTGSRTAGFISGLIFAFLPYRMARIAGNLPLVDTQWLPLFLFFLERFIRNRRWFSLAGSGLCFALASLSSWYYAMMLAILTPIYFFARLQRYKLKLIIRPLLGGSLVFLFVAVVLVGPFLIPHFALHSTDSTTVPLDEAAFWAADITSFLIPNPRNFLWGDWVQANLTPFPEGLPYEYILGFGYIPLILALYGWRHASKDLKTGWRWWFWAALLLSLGPVLKVLNHVVAIPLPHDLVAGYNNLLNWIGLHSVVGETFSLADPDKLVITGPALYARWLIPGLGDLRSWGRFAFLAAMTVAVFAGFGFDRFLRHEIKSGRYGVRWAIVIVVILVLFEFYPGPAQLIKPGPRDVDRWLANQPIEGTIIQMPLSSALSGPQHYYSIHHGQSVASGYGTYLPILFENKYPQLQDFPSPESLDVLRNWGSDVPGARTGISWILIDEKEVAANDPLWTQLINQNTLELVTIQDGVRVYRFTE